MNPIKTFGLECGDGLVNLGGVGRVLAVANNRQGPVDGQINDFDDCLAFADARVGTCSSEVLCEKKTPWIWIEHAKYALSAVVERERRAFITDGLGILQQRGPRLS